MPGKGAENSKGKRNGKCGQSLLKRKSLTQERTKPEVENWYKNGEKAKSALMSTEGLLSTSTGKGGSRRAKKREFQARIGEDGQNFFSSA